MKIVFFGTSEFGIPALEKLKASGYELVTIITRPDKPAGRRQELAPSPVKLWAMKHNIPVYQPERLNLDSKFVTLDSDLFVVASYGKIIPKKIIDLPKYGTLNIHPSLLPKYRGPSPIHAAILNGDEETGVTIMQMDEELDHGPVIGSRRLEVGSLDYQALHDRLAQLGAELLIKVLSGYFAGAIKPVLQDHSKATYTKMISQNDARIDWRRSARDIEQQIRAFCQWPVAWTMVSGKRLKIFHAVIVSGNPLPTVVPGQLFSHKHDLLVQCGAGALRIRELQLEGKKKMPAAEFTRGRKDLLNQILT